MQKSDSPLPAVTLSQPTSTSDSCAVPPEPLNRKSARRWFVAALHRLQIIVATMGLLLILYVGSYFATAFATGAGWMEVATRQRIVWTVYWPLSKCAVRESRSGPRFINDANAWFFKVGWQCRNE